MDTETKRPWEGLSALIEAGADEVRLVEYLDELPGTEAALAISRLEETDRTRLMERLSPVGGARLFARLPAVEVVDLVEHLDPDVAAAILHELHSDERADIIGDLEAASADAVLAELPEIEASQARRLSKYDDDVAGGLMIREFVSFRDTDVVGSVLDRLAAGAEKYRAHAVQYLFVVNAEKRLRGVLRLRDLILAPRDARTDEVMLTDPLSVGLHESLDELRAFFDRHSFLAVPVVSAHGTLVGLVRRSAVEDAVVERAEADLLKTQGIVGGEELRSMPAAVRARRRLGWLTVNILLNVLAASVIAAFQDTLSAVIALAVFLPIISDMSGCSGNQAVAVSMRELSLGLVRPGEIVRVWLKEVSVGALNGLVLGALIAAVAWIWQGNAWLGLVVGAALALNTVIAVSLGGTVPLVMKRLGIDPALASGPILTTVTDMCGFLLTLGFATLALARLTG